MSIKLNYTVKDVKKPVDFIDRLFLCISLRYMKFKLLIITCFLSFSFGLKAQNELTDVRFSASYNQMDLADILVDISKRTKVNIAFDPAILEEFTDISLQVRDEKLSDVLDVLLDDRRLGFIISGKQLIVVEDKPVIRDFDFPTEELSGYIEDGSSGERLPFAYLYTPDGEVTVTTNEYGFYSIQVPEGTKGLYVSYLGYDDTYVTLEELASQSNKIAMNSITELEEVVITDESAENPVVEFDQFNTTELSTIKSIQTFGGQMDIFRHIQTLPGVTSGADGLGGTSVRGGNVDNNLILLDGIPVYNTSHALGVLSIFDQASIKNARFYRSHIPSRYGGRLSSVLDIRTKEGNLNKFGGEVNIGALSSSIYLEGPIVKDKVSFAVSARRTLFEPYLSGLSSFIKEASDREGETGYFFYDINAKLQFVLNDKNRLYLSYYGGQDSFQDITLGTEIQDTLTNEVENNYDWIWGNRLISLRLSSQLSSNVFSNISIFNTGYNFSAYNYNRVQVDGTNSTLVFDNVASLYNTVINDWGLKWDIDHYINDKNRYKVGLLAINHSFSPGLLTRRNTDVSLDSEALRDELTDAFSPEVREANEVEAYYEHEYRYRGLLVNAGARLSLINTNERNYLSIQPRVSIKGKLADRFYGKLSGNYTTQYLHLLASSGLGLPTDIWIPSTDVIRPQKSYQVSGGVEYEISKGLIFSSEGYYKFLWDILNLQEGAVFSVIEDEDWENNIPVGQGNAYGWENSLIGTYKNHFFNINYTLSYSTRLFDEINAGEVFFSRFDRRHQLNAAYRYDITKNISLNSQFVFATGHPITLPRLINQGQIVFTERNSQRLPVYDRLDVTLRIQSHFDWGTQIIALGAYNVYNKQNPYLFFVDFDTPTEFTLKQVTIFPILPNISYTIKF